MSKRRRDARQAARGRRWQRRIWMIGGGLGAAVLLVLGLRAAGVFEPAPASIDLNSNAYRVAAGETVGTRVGSQGNAHVLVGQKASYNSVPPTSGGHWNQSGVAPAPWGIKDAMLPNEVTTHNLEHGGVVIAYSTSLSSDDVTKLKSLVRGVSGTYRKVILEPYPLTDAKIALTAWTWILKLPEYDESQIVKFIKAHHQSSDAPEPNGF